MSPVKVKRKQVSNIGASVRTRLLNIAKKGHQDYNRVLIRFAQERLLYRFSVSRYRGNFILKGVLPYLAYAMSHHSPTKDVDFLGHAVTNDLEEIQGLLKEIVGTHVDDAVVFDPATVVVERITDEAEYGGARTSVWCSVGGIELPLQIDVGFGDRIVGGPIDIDFPVMLDFPHRR
jgi:hypothetical protein